MPQAIPASKRTANIISSAGRGYRDTSSGTRYLGRGVEADVHLPTATVREAERSRAHAIRDGQEGGHELGEFQLQRRHRARDAVYDRSGVSWQFERAGRTSCSARDSLMRSSSSSAC